MEIAWNRRGTETFTEFDGGEKTALSFCLVRSVARVESCGCVWKIALCFGKPNKHLPLALPWPFRSLERFELAAGG
jgi:hypothetical protein